MKRHGFFLKTPVKAGSGIHVLPKYSFQEPEGVERFLRDRKEEWWFAVADWGGNTGDWVRLRRKRDLLAWIAEELGSFLFEDGVPYSFEAYLRVAKDPEAGWEESFELSPRAEEVLVPVEVREAGLVLRGKISLMPGR